MRRWFAPILADLPVDRRKDIAERDITGSKFFVSVHRHPRVAVDGGGPAVGAAELLGAGAAVTLFHAVGRGWAPGCVVARRSGCGNA